MVGVNNVPEDVLGLIAQDTEFRVRELVYQAQKYAYHEHRDKLTIEDLNMALKANNSDVLHEHCCDFL